MLTKIFAKQQMWLAFTLKEGSFLIIYLGKKRVNLRPAHTDHGSVDVVAILARLSPRAVEVS